MMINESGVNITAYGENFHVNGVYFYDGRILVKAGSSINRSYENSFYPYLINERNFILSSAAPNFVFQKDYVFGSSLIAGSICSGKLCSGLSLFRTFDGRFLKDYLNRPDPDENNFSLNSFSNFEENNNDTFPSDGNINQIGFNNFNEIDTNEDFDLSNVNIPNMRIDNGNQNLPINVPNIYLNNDNPISNIQSYDAVNVSDQEDEIVLDTDKRDTFNVYVDDFIVSPGPSRNSNLLTVGGLEKPRFESSNFNYYSRMHHNHFLACRRASFRCEINPNHQTFFVEEGRPFVEVRYLIPLSEQKYFRTPLKCYENLIALCPTCAKTLQYGSNIKDILFKLYNLRKKDLEKVGIKLSFKTLYSFYNKNYKGDF